MRYPTLPDLLDLHRKVCRSVGEDASVRSMEAVQRAVLGPQRIEAQHDEDSSSVARQSASLIIPLVEHRAFENCNDRVALAATQVFLDRNGFTIDASVEEFDRFSLRLSSQAVTKDELTSWLASRITNRFNERRLGRMLGAMNRLAEVVEDLRELPGLHTYVDRLDRAGFSISQEISNFARLSEGSPEEVLEMYPAFQEMWGDAFDGKGQS